MPTTLIILIAALIAALISGIFGMAGGMIYMGVIASLLGVSEAMIVHGFVQGISNSYRSFLLRPDIRWDIIRNIVLGAVPAVALLALAAYVPQKGVLFLVLGLLPFLLWFPKGWFQGNAEKPVHAMICGALVMALNLVAGVAGPAMDYFFVKTDLTRKEIVATKAIVAFGSHLIKIFYFGIPLILSTGLSGLPPAWVFAALIPAIMIGTFAGTRILHLMSDVNFRNYTKYLVSVVGLVYIYRAATLFGWL